MSTKALSRANVFADIPPAPEYRRTALIGWITLAVFVIGFCSWAAIVKIASGAVTQGEVRVEGNRRTVQHLEGGIIREFLVREGDPVAAGQVLMRLDETQAGANSDLLSGQFDALRAQEARLRAEIEGATWIAFPETLIARRNEPRVLESLAGQEAIFASRTAALSSQIAVLDQRIQGLRAEIRAAEAQSEASRLQLSLTRDELRGQQDLLRQGFTTRTRVLELQRREADLQGTMRQQAEVATRARQSIAEAEAQQRAVRDERVREATTELRDVQTRLIDTQERLRAASDVRRRLEVTAPIAGVVANLRFYTVGGVIRPGEPILDIVPQNEDLIIEVQIQPQDIDIVAVDLPAEVRITAYRSRSSPVMLGRVIYVAADITLNERAGTSHYRAQVRIDRDQLHLLEGFALQPGMPAEVIVMAGERTMFEYLTQPIRSSLRRAFRER
jgi:HlyD family type I secretion membrane fusion protein